MRFRNIILHFTTVTRHRMLVCRLCFKVGLYWQGLIHDLSKYSPTEFWVGCRYYQGNRSPNNKEREEEGLSKAWLHHKGRNRHHYEYWIDYSTTPGESLAGMPMPTRFVVEMFIDRIAACKIYLKENYTKESPLKYYQQGAHHMIIHPNSQELLEKLLLMLSQKGEAYVFAYIRKYVLPRRW